MKWQKTDYRPKKRRWINYKLNILVAVLKLQLPHFTQPLGVGGNGVELILKYNLQRLSIFWMFLMGIKKWIQFKSDNHKTFNNLE